MAYIEGQDKGGTPLIELYDHGSKFTALKYSDFEGRNTSASGPLVSKDILDPPKSNSFSLQANARIDDLTRITKLLTKPGGIKFATNQAILNTAANRSSDNIFKKLGGGAVTALKAIGSTLAQVPVNGTGLHFIYGFGEGQYLRKGGGEPNTGLGRFLRNNLNIGNQGLNAGAAALAGTTIIPDNNGDPSYQPLVPSGLTQLNSSLGIAPPPAQPPVTNIPPTFDDLSQNVASVVNYLRVEANRVARTGGKIATNRVKGSNIDDQTSQFILPGGDKPVNTNLAPSEARTDIKIPLYFLKDGRRYNQSPLNFENKFWLPESNVDLLASQTEELTGRQDIIPFRFNTFTPGGEKYLYFRAFLDSFDDNYTGEWTGTRYIGRAEEFYTYQGFNRKITFSFKVAALSREHLVPLYEKLNYLASSTAPTYGDSGQFMRGTFCNVTIGDYLFEQDGFISSVGLSWQKEYPWEIDVDENDSPILPHMLDVSIEFTPIHNFNVKEDINNTTQRYFGPRVQGFVDVGEGEFGPPIEEPKTAFAYFADKTIEYDIATGKTVAINGQPVKSANGGWAYAADGRQATTTKVNGTNGTIVDAGTDDSGNPLKKVNLTGN